MIPGGERRGADQLFAELDARFRGPLMAYFVRRVSSYAEAEDLTQETFVRLMSAHSFTETDQVNPYVFRVASNLLCDRARSEGRRKTYPISTVNPVLIERAIYTSAEDRSAERVLIGRERLAEVLSCLDELGERTKNVFILSRLEGMKQKDIAMRYKMGISTVEKCVMAAMLHLAKHFDRETNGIRRLNKSS
jgi:RNA polymerase sigma factor (sigma-70 family)